MRLLVCGSRVWANRQFLYRVLDAIHKREPIDMLIEGDAKGADRMAGDWANKNKVSVRKFPAIWMVYGRGAGPIRNQQMLDEGRPERVLAFNNDIAASTGTRDMVRRAKGAMLPTRVVTEKDEVKKVWWAE